MNTYLKNFERDGYCVIKNAIPKEECKKLIRNTLLPILHKKGIYLTKPKTWNYKYSKRKEGILIAGRNGGHIISKRNKHFRFPAMYNSQELNTVLNLLHSRNSNISKWKYQYLGNEGLGWIHLRFPCINYDKKQNKNKQFPLTDNSFHLDGMYVDTNNNTKVNPEQSVVILPFITTVKKNGGGTAVIPSSHKEINNYLLRYNYNSDLDTENIIDNVVNKKQNKIIDVCGNQGDVLVIHPHLIHGSSLASNKSRTRITFNIGTMYNN